MRPPVWKQVAIYGAVLAAGTLGLQWLDYLYLARFRSTEIYLLVVALAFLALGVYIGVRVLAPPRPPPPPGNPQAQAGLGITPAELAVLKELAAGHSNKEIAQHLQISPNTVKTHVARLFEKLGARRRTEAINRARELGIVP